MTAWTISKGADDIISVLAEGQPDAPAPELAFCWQSLPVAGGALDVDVSDPLQPLRAHVADVAAAAWWLPFVFGDEVAIAVADLAEDATGGSVTVECEAAGDLYTPARRLLTGFWLRRWWPSDRQGIPPVQEWLLEVELGALAYAADMLFTSQAPARDLLEDHLGILGAQFERYAAAAGGDEGLDQLARVLFDAIGAALQTVDARADGYDDLALIEQRFEERESLVARERDELGGDVIERFELLDRVAAWLSESSGLPQSAMVPEPTRDYSGAPARESAGNPHESARTGIATIDWSEVHPRSVYRDEARWSVTGDTITVTLDTPPGTVPVLEGELYVRANIDGRVVAIGLDRAPGGFVGQREVEGLAGAQSIVASVYSDRFSAGGRTPTPPLLVAVRQARVIEVVRQRLTSATTGHGDTAFAFELAAVLDESDGVIATEELAAALSSAPLSLRLDRLMLAAHTEATDLAAATTSENGLSVTLASLGPSSVHIGVTADAGTAERGDVVVVESVDDHQRIRVAIVLVPDATGGLRGDATLSTTSPWLDVTLRLPQPAIRLSEDLVAVIADSVRATSTEGRTAWVEIARDLPETHPLHVAIREGLS